MVLPGGGGTDEIKIQRKQQQHNNTHTHKNTARGGQKKAIRCWLLPSARPLDVPTRKIKVADLPHRPPRSIDDERQQQQRRKK